MLRTPKGTARHIDHARPLPKPADDKTDTVSDWLSGMDGLDGGDEVTETQKPAPDHVGRGRRGTRDFW